MSAKARTLIVHAAPRRVPRRDLVGGVVGVSQAATNTEVSGERIHAVDGALNASGGNRTRRDLKYRACAARVGSESWHGENRAGTPLLKVRTSGPTRIDSTSSSATTHLCNPGPDALRGQFDCLFRARSRAQAGPLPSSELSAYASEENSHVEQDCLSARPASCVAAVLLGLPCPPQHNKQRPPPPSPVATRRRAAPPPARHRPVPHRQQCRGRRRSPYSTAPIKLPARLRVRGEFRER
jgi:hypothetical protein